MTTETQVIQMDKKYKTRDGLAVRILCVDNYNNQTHPVIGLVSNGVVASYQTNGKYLWDADSCNDLVEIKPYEDFKIDEPVMVQDKQAKGWYRGHFAGVRDGKVTIWCSGGTSFTTTHKVSWDECRRPTSLEALGPYE